MVNLTISYMIKIKLFRTDGILSTLMREGVAAENDDKRWYLFDGKSWFSFKNQFTKIPML